MIQYFFYIVAFGDVRLSRQHDQTLSSSDSIYLHIYSIFVDVWQLVSTVGKLCRLFTLFYFIFSHCVCLCARVFFTQHLKRPVWRIWCWKHCRKTPHISSLILNFNFERKHICLKMTSVMFCSVCSIRPSHWTFLKKKLVTDFQPTRSKMLFFLQMNVNVLQMMGELLSFFLPVLPSFFLPQFQNAVCANVNWGAKGRVFQEVGWWKVVRRNDSSVAGRTSTFPPPVCLSVTKFLEFLI